MHTSLLFSPWQQSPKDKHGSGRRHRSTHEQGALVAAIETFNPVGRVNHSAHIFGKPQIGEIGRIAFSVQSGKARVLLAPTSGKGTQILIGRQRSHVGMLHRKERLEFLSDLGFVFGGNGVQDLAFEMHDAELVAPERVRGMRSWKLQP